MEFTETPLSGSYLIDIDPIGDERGFFARLFCSHEFDKLGIESHIKQINNSTSSARGTLRGMHYQIPPMEETKIVRCIKGAIWDLILDIRPHSPTFGHSFGVELSESNRRMLFVPKGFAHGFLTLTDDSEIIYFVSQNYSKQHERGIRWDDPAFDLQWPFAPKVLSERDKNHQDFDLDMHKNEILMEA